MSRYLSDVSLVPPEFQKSRNESLQEAALFNSGVFPICQDRALFAFWASFGKGKGVIS